LALVALLLVAAVATAQENEFTQMSDLLEQGYYNSAARLNGPELVARYPDSGRAHFLYARALYLTGNLTGALTELDRAVAIDGESDPAVVNLQGLLRAANGDPAGALRALQNAFLRSRDYQFAMDWGRVAWQAARYDEAIAAFDAAATTDEGRSKLWPYVDKGRLLVFTDRLPEAITAFNAAIDVFEATDPGEARPGSPAYVEAYYRLGEAYERLGEIDRAEVNYRAAKTADPNYAPAIQALDRLSRSFE
jgi:tetratricopeptide (TPR) repeat protein